VVVGDDVDTADGKPGHIQLLRHPRRICVHYLPDQEFVADIYDFRFHVTKVGAILVCWGNS
jgi:hypothetical protein